MRDLLWLTPLEALAVVIATAGMYVALVILVRVLGQRMLSGLSSFDLAAVIAFGAILGRASLGHVPVLGGGLVALLEPNGMLSILRAGTAIDPRLLSGVIGASLVPEDLLER